MKQLECENPKSIARTLVGEHVISTVVVRPTDPADSMPFETMVFKSDDAEGMVSDWGEVEVQRYATEDKAIVGHEQMCAKWAAKAEAT